jgi:hypothetical protein
MKFQAASAARAAFLDLWVKGGGDANDVAQKLRM